MNILQSLADQAKKRKDQLVHDIAQAPAAVGHAVSNIGAAPHPVQAISPQAQQAITHARFGVLAQNNNGQRYANVLQQSQRQNAPSVAHGLNTAMDAFNDSTAHAGRFIAQQGVTIPAMELAQSVRQHVTHKPSSYTPGSPAAKAIFGDSPVQSLQFNHQTTQNNLQHSSNPLLRASAPLLAGANTALHVANDIPIAGVALKGAVKGTQLAAPAVTKGIEQVAPKALPAVKGGAKVIADQHAAANLRMNSVEASNNEKRVIQQQLKGTQKQMAQVPLGPQGARGTSVLMGKQDQLQAQLAQNRAAHRTIQNPVQAVTDRLLTAQPGLSMKDVSKQPELPTPVPSTTPKPRLPGEAKAVPGTPASRGTQLPGESSLPEYRTKTVPKRDLAFRSTRSVIERQGEHGKTLANELQASRDTEELYQAHLSKQLPTVRSLKGKDYENFVEATQGKAEASSPKIAQAVKEWQAVHPGIRDRAVAAGLDVGDLGPQYYPHFIDYDKVFKDKNQYNTAINHLVSTGQAKTPEEAIKLLNYAKDVSRNRSFGNLEAQRLVDLPMYDKTPDSLVSYLQGSAHRIAQTEHFGAKDEKALSLITKAGQQGYDTEAMKNAYDIAVGAKRYGATASEFSRKARAFQSTTRLGLGAITNSSQNVNTGIVTGHIRTLGAMVKQLSPKTRSFVEDTGVIGDAVLQDIKTQTGFTGKVLGKITAPGFGKVENFNRSVAATAGRDYALRLAQKGNEKVLRRLGVTGPIEGRTLTEAQQIQAARKVVEKTQFKVDPQDLPGWTDSPGGKLVAQFRTFSYNQSKFFSNEIIKPMGRLDFKPVARLMAALPLGYALYETKRVINGRPEEENKTKRGLQAFQNVGGAGLAFDIYQSLNPTNSQYLPADRRVSMGVSTIGGPTAGLATQAIGAANDLIQRKNVPVDPSRLDGHLAVGNNGKTYTDATQAGRFALNQIPVVGAPIRNRVLPYKAQSQADTGTKSTGTPVDQLEARKKQQTKDLRGSLSAEDYKLSQLSKADRQKLVSQGKYSQSKFDGLDNYVNNKRKQLGMSVVADKTNNKIPVHSQKVLDEYNKLDQATREKKAYKENDYDYKVAVAKYDNDKANGKLSRAEDIRRQDTVARAKIGSAFSKDTRDLYGLSKDEVYDLITTDNNGKKIASDLLAYGDALQKGTGTQNKFRTKKGVESFQTANRGGSGGSGRSKSLSTLLAEFKTPYSDEIKNATKGASLARSAHLAKKSA